LEIILIALMVIGVIAFIAYPLFSTPHGNISETPDALEVLISQRDSTYDAIRDLDFDFQLGKLSQADYAPLRDKYKARAAETLKQIDALTGKDNPVDAEAQIEVQVAQLRQAKGDSIEAEVARLRRAKTDAVEAEIARVRTARRSSEARCANCGTPFQSGDRFCAKCGSELMVKS
jgi:rRNA maturation endonuclease Nob1